MSHPHLGLGDCHHCTLYDCFADNGKGVGDDFGNLPAIQSLSSDANHRGPTLATQCDQGVKVGIERHDYQIGLTGAVDDLPIRGLAHAEFRDVGDNDSLLGKPVNRTARQTLIE